MAVKLSVIPFNSGIHRGLILRYFDSASIFDVSIDVDLTEFYERGLIKQIGSIEMFSQYGRLVVTDKQTGITRYANISTMVSHVLNSKTKRLNITYSNTSGSPAPVSYDVLLYESVQPTLNQLVVLP